MKRDLNAGIIRVRSVKEAFAISKLQVVKDYALARLAAVAKHGDSRTSPSGIGIALPLAVRREFARMIAIKVLAWIGEDSYPQVIPALSLQPAEKTSPVCWKGSPRLASQPADVWVAANILTFEAISYQAKGRWSASGKTGAIRVQEIHAGGPPYPGGRVA